MMLSYKIISKNSPLNSHEAAAEFEGAAGEKLRPEALSYRRNLFDRAKKFLTFKEGDRVRISGSRVCGEISRIFYEFEEVQWRNNTPYFIEVVLDNGESWSYNVRQLTRKKVTPKATP